MRDDELAGLRQPEFPIALRGYDREAVDAYIAHVSGVLSALEANSSPQAAVRFALDQVSEETKGILQRAHDAADELTARSRAQAQERIDDAERQARDIVRDAQTRTRVLDQDADEIWQERKRLIDDVQRVADELSELAESASRRFPPETPESGADTAPIETAGQAAALPPPPEGGATA